MPTDTRPAGKGYALWLIPEEPMFSLLAGRISRLSQRFSTPLFEPHVTLLGGIMVPEEEAVEKSASLADLLRPFQIVLGEIGYSHEYFRSLFASVIPAGPIMKAHRAALETFRLRDAAAYKPHLSLLYGRLQVETKTGIATAQSLLSGRAFQARSLTLYRARGSPQEWKRVAAFDLG